MLFVGLFQSLLSVRVSRLVLIPALALFLAGCCLGGRDNARFAGSADILPVPSEMVAEAEAVVSGEVEFEYIDTETETEEEVVSVYADEPAVAPAIPSEIVPSRARAMFARLDSAIYFDYDLAYLKPTGVRVLKSWVKALKRYPDMVVTVRGHTDTRGTRDYNLWLGERRAKAVQDFLVIRGVENKRIRLISYGEESLAIRGNSDKAHALNRRASLTAEPSRTR